MTINDIEKIRELFKTKKAVPLTEIPTAFKQEFDTFFFGKTLMRENDILCAYPHDIKNWIRVLLNKYED